MNYMDADSISHMMHCQHLITDEDYEAITTAPNDSKMNIAILEYVRAMDLTSLLTFADLLKCIEAQQSIGDNLKSGNYVCVYVRISNLILTATVLLYCNVALTLHFFSILLVYSSDHCLQFWRNR